MKNTRFFFFGGFFLLLSLAILFSAQEQNFAIDTEQNESVPQEEFVENIEQTVVPKTQNGEERKSHSGARVVVNKAEQGRTYELSDITFDEKKKKAKVVAHVEKGVDYFNKHGLRDSSYAFSNRAEFLAGELYLFIDRSDGVVCANVDSRLLWQDLLGAKDSFGVLYEKKILDTALAGGGWVTYEWRGAVKTSYVKKVESSEGWYAIGTGYYSHAKEDAVVSLVKGAVSLVDEVIKRGDPIEQAFSVLSYPGSERFIRGDLYLYAVQFDGIQKAHGLRPGLIGTNALDYKDANGKLVNREIIEQLRRTKAGVWVDYVSRGAKKRAYAERVVDAQGGEYFVACGYHPDIDRDEVVELVKKGYQFMKTSGKQATIAQFSDIRESEFHHGDLYLTVYDMNGVCITHGENPEFIGRNMKEVRDEDGNFYVRELLRRAKEQEWGWVDAKLNNSFLSMYFTRINLGLEEFVIVSGLYPVSKIDVIALLVKGASTALQTSKTNEEAFRRFIDPKGGFIRGDLFVFVLDDLGYCYAYGDQYHLIWKNLMGLKDDQGQQFVKLMIDQARNGSTYLTFTRQKETYVAYVQRVEKNGVGFTIGSGFYK